MRCLCAFVLCLFCSPAWGQLVTPAKEKALRALLPKIGDSELAEVLSDPKLVWYTGMEMPECYQHRGGETHSVRYNISANPIEQASGTGNAFEFPWRVAGGTDGCRSLYVFRFLKLPRRDGKPLPVIWWREVLTGDRTPGFRWVFPVGTVVGEVLCQTGPASEKRAYAFEIRTRTRRAGKWDTEAYRPFRTPLELARAIKRLCPQWRDDRKVRAAVNELERPTRKLRITRLADTNHRDRVAFDATEASWILPDLDGPLVKRLLRRMPFRAVLGNPFLLTAAGEAAHAPSTTAEFHIVPKGYQGSHIEVSNSSCARCHESTNKSVNEFDFRRDWYGRVRGSDGIFSFHPFSPESISANGYGRPVTMRRELVQAGIVEQYDQKKHDGATWHTLGTE